MAEFGQALLRERERRALPRVTVARATGIYIHYLAALEHGDFEELPDQRTVEGFVRTYAGYLSLDVEAVIDEYRRARPAAPPDARPAATPSAEPPAAARPRRISLVRVGVPLVVAAIVACCALAGGWWLLRDDPTGEVTASPRSAPVVPAAGATTDVGSAGPALPAPEPVGLGSPGAPTVSESGVGTGVVDHRLVGEGTTFPAGSRVWFWTRVLGGAPGSRIRHVWLFDGRVVESIRLRVGSANWRTQSAKVLQAAGRWTVEARAEDGTVLARSELTAVE